MNDNPRFIKGLDLCEGFFFDTAKPLLDKFFPSLLYTAALIGYGSDVLGYDDEVSRDHMWGPRFCLFLSADDIGRSDEIMNVFSHNLPCTYMGYSVNFTAPDPNDNGVRHPQYVESGPVSPLIFIRTFESYLDEQLGTQDIDALTPFDWLSFSEHRLLSLTSGRIFADGLGCGEVLSKLKYYPEDVRLYLIASNWAAIASEQAFVGRCMRVGDEMGMMLCTSRIAERLMRLCFLYRGRYAPYSKWFGTAFARLDVDERLGELLRLSLTSPSMAVREDAIAEAQALTARLHNESAITPPVGFEITDYYGRDCKVIYADRFADAVSERLVGTAFENLPLIGSFSQYGGLSDFSDEPRNFKKIARFYM